MARHEDKQNDGMRGAGRAAGAKILQDQPIRLGHRRGGACPLRGRVCPPSGGGWGGAATAPRARVDKPAWTSRWSGLQGGGLSPALWCCIAPSWVVCPPSGGWVGGKVQRLRPGLRWTSQLGPLDGVDSKLVYCLLCSGAALLLHGLCAPHWGEVGEVQ